MEQYRNLNSAIGNSKHLKNLVKMKYQIKEIVLLFIFSILAMAQMFAQNSKTDWEKDGLNGKVKSWEKTMYEAVDKYGEIVKEENLNGNLKKYDYNGNLIESASFSRGKISSSAHYKYDDKGILIEKIRYRSDGSLYDKDSYKYDDQENCIEIITYEYSEGLSYKRSFKYDDKGNTVEQYHYYSDGSLSMKWIFRYDEQGNCIEVIQFENDENKPRAIYETIIEYYE